MNVADLVIVIWAVLAAVSGFRRGASLQVLEYAGLLAGLVAGALAAPRLAHLAPTGLPRSVFVLVVLLAGAAAGEALGWVLGRRVWRVTRRSPLRSVDSLAGSIVGVLALLLAAWFIAFNLVGGPFQTVNQEIRTSAIITHLDDTLPKPPTVLAGARRFLADLGFPQVFVGIPPESAGPVRTPNGALARRLATAADGSVVRISGQACGLIQEGSGFVVGPNEVVTNAHVVAGVRRPILQGSNVTERATVVLFDPRVDVAILRAPRTLGPVLRLRSSDVPRGTGGAVLGYPGGGPYAYGPAAVRADLRASGRDIYGTGLVYRDVYELQAIVRPGNSGGPFILRGGLVGGMVFSRSTTNPDVGYALTAKQILPDVEAARHLTGGVSTGACVG